MITPPTALLVHGAFADSAGWSAVIGALQGHGIPVLAPPNPLRGLASDAAYIASLTAQIDGTVVLVGHSYGGAVVSVAGTADNVVGLVYIAAYMPAEGESLGELQERFLPSLLTDSLRARTYPRENGEPGVEVTIAEGAFPAVFAADLPPETARVLAAAQRPVAAVAFSERASAAAWRTKPSWVLVAGADKAINPEVERFGAKRAGSTVIEVDGASHAVAVSQPGEVAELIRDAVRATT
ncbi:alpha/beta fold hydrolase [Streptomyces griseosporeus]|uniref:alpha/beta fold hydrolase n=1 Tax=Streptomyces griseosporeus TaxID=1910 RepID=UPI00167E1A08|nr:alpha/beta hydrolase [Streptomyces griseosporeus]GHF37260.1 alpha/beta hydrolase [Streptomyces griseosporeus]